MPLLVSAQVSVKVENLYHESSQGESIQFQFLSSQSGPVQYRINKSKYLPSITESVVNLTAGVVTTITYTPTEPGVYFCHVTQNGITATAGACYERGNLQAIQQIPYDFDSFWNNFKWKLNAIPMDPHLIYDSETAYSKTFRLDMASIDGRRAYAYLSIPKQSGKFTGFVRFPAFGNSQTVSPGIPMCEQTGAIIISVNIHNAPPNVNIPENKLYKPDLNQTDTVYYRWAIAAAMRAVDYLHTMPEFDGEHVGAYGVSQGAGLAMLYAGIDNRIDLVIGANPILSQHNGLAFNRPSGFPTYLINKLDNPSEVNRIIEASKYYDVVHAMQKFKGPLLETVSVLDMVTPSEATYTAFNQHRGKVVHIHDLVSGHLTSISDSWSSRFEFVRRYFPVNPSWPWETSGKGYEADAGYNQENTCLTANLEGKIDDNGTINPSNIPVQWAKISGPGTVTFSDARNYNTTATFSLPGSYVLRFVGIESSKINTEHFYYSIEDDVAINVCLNNSCLDITLINPASDATATCNDEENNDALETWLNNHGGANVSSSSAVTWENNFQILGNLCSPTPVTFWAHNECGTTVTTTANITLQNETPPSFLAQATNKTVSCDGSNNADLQAWLSNNGGAIASTPCGNVTWSNDYAQMQNNSVTVNFIATSDCGQSNTTTATFTINDAAPTLLAQAKSKNIICNNQNMTALNDWLTNHGGAKANENNITWQNNFTNLAPLCSPTKVIFTATNTCGQSVKTEAYFTIEDNTPPILETPASAKFVICDGNGNTDELNEWLANNGDAIASESCSDLEWSNDFVELNDACSSTSVTFTTTNQCGLSTTTMATFVIQDNTPPVLETPATNQSVDCNNQIEEHLQAWLDNNGGAVATETCSNISWTNDFDTFENNNVEVLFTATNECGLETTTMASFSIKNTSPMFLAKAADQTAFCNGNGNEDELNNWLNAHGNASIDETNEDIIWTNDFINLAELCTPTVVVFTATNACGFEATTTASFLVKDETSPIFSQAANDIQITCNTTGEYPKLDSWLEDSGNAVATDECSEVIWLNNFNGIDCTDTTITVTFWVEDACGNSAATSGKIIITKPVAVNEATKDKPFLYQNRPNPYHDKTTIPFNLPKSGIAQITIYDIYGQVLQKIKAFYPQGENVITIDNSKFISRGTYYYQLEIDGYRSVKQMIFMD